MAEAKTKPTTQSVTEFINAIEDEQVRKDCTALVRIMKKVTGSAPKMWGPGIVGFGQYHYKYESGHEGDSCLTGFAPRKQNITLYVMGGAPGQAALLEKLGKHKVGKGCVYIKKLADVDAKMLEQVVAQGVNHIKKQYPSK